MQQIDLLPVRLSTRRAWLVCLSAALFCGYSFIQLQLLTTLGGHLAQELALQPMQLGAITASYLYSVWIFLIPAGVLLDLYSPRTLILTALFTSMFSIILLAVAYSPSVVLLARVIGGFAGAFGLLSGIKLISHWFDKRHCALPCALLFVIALLSSLLARAPLGWLATRMDWRMVLTLDVAIGALIALWIAAVVVDTPSEPHAHPRHIRAHLRTALCNQHNWLYGIYCGLLTIPLYWLSGMWGKLYLIHIHQLNHRAANTVSSVLLLGALLATPAIGWLVDHSNMRRALMLLGAAASSVLVAVIMLFPQLGFNSVLVLYLMLGFTLSSQIISYPAVIAHHHRSVTAASVSIVSFVTLGLSLCYQPLFSWLMNVRFDGGRSIAIAHYSPDHFAITIWLLPAVCVIALVAAWLTDGHR